MVTIIDVKSGWGNQIYNKQTLWSFKASIPKSGGDDEYCHVMEIKLITSLRVQCASKTVDLRHIKTV